MQSIKDRHTVPGEVFIPKMREAVQDFFKRLKGSQLLGQPLSIADSEKCQLPPGMEMKIYDTLTGKVI